MDARERRAVHDLLVRLADGDRAALRPAFERVSPLVHRFCARLLGGAPDAADTAQEALVRVFARIGELDPSRDAVAWTLGVAAWECRSTRRRRSRSRESSLEPGAAETVFAGPTPEETAMERELVEAAGDVLGALRPADAETILEALAGEREPGTNFRKRLSRALERMRAEWRRRHE